ncbi:hypothetical protein WMY93_000978 [Mugilogobius chulae]|uniref:Uncharacterized protein n=1 Tax=Mugilogobius chulae TaxID=88201 RepID=A0AAW0QBM2_9GOBI
MTGSEEQSLCEAKDPDFSTAEVCSEDSCEEDAVSEGSSQVFSGTEVFPLSKDVTPTESDQEHPLENNQETEAGGEEQGLHETQNQQTDPETVILEGPSVACFLIPTLDRKLVRKSFFKQENQTDIISLLLDKTRENILYQDVPISINDMRAVAKAAAKDLVRDYKHQRLQLRAEDEDFQEAVVKHLNQCMSNFLFGPKKTRLSCLFTAVGKLVRCP